MITVEDLYQELLAAARGGDLAKLECLLTKKELNEEVIAQKDNEVLNVAAIYCPSPIIAKYEKTQHEAFIKRLLNIDSVGKLFHKGLHDVSFIILYLKEEALRNLACNKENLQEIARLLNTMTLGKQAAKLACLRAASHGHLDILKRILYEVDKQDLEYVLHPDMISLLVQAVDGGHLPVVDYLLSREEVAKQLHEFDSAFRAACYAKNVPIVDRFLRERAVQAYSAECYEDILKEGIQDFALLDRLLQERHIRKMLVRYDFFDPAKTFSLAVETGLPVIMYRVALDCAREAELFCHLEDIDGHVEDIQGHDFRPTPFYALEKTPSLAKTLLDLGYPDLSTFMRKFPQSVWEEEKLKRTRLGLSAESEISSREQVQKEALLSPRPFVQLKPYFLLWAAEYGHMDVLKDCLDEPADERHYDELHYNLRALQLAAQNGHLAVIHILLTRKEFQYALSTDPMSVLHRAIFSRFIEQRSNPPFDPIPLIERLFQEQTIKAKLSRFVLLSAMKAYNYKVFERLLEEKEISEKIAENDNEIVYWAATSSDRFYLRRLVIIPQIKKHPTFHNIEKFLVELFDFCQYKEEELLEILDLLLSLQAFVQAISAHLRRLLIHAVLNRMPAVLFMLIREYQTQGYPLPQDVVDSVHLFLFMNMINCDNIYHFFREFPNQVIEKQENVTHIKTHLLPYLPADPARLVSEYAATPLTQVYRIMQPYFQVHQNRTMICQEIRDGVAHPLAKERGLIA